MTKNELIAMVTMNEATRETASAMIDSKRDDLIASLVKLRKDWDKAMEDAFPEEVVNAIYKTYGYEQSVTFDYVYCKKDDKYYKLGFEKRNGRVRRYLNVYENTYTTIPLFKYNEFDTALIVPFEKVYEGSEYELGRWAEKVIKAKNFLDNFNEVVTEIYKMVSDKSKERLEKRISQLQTIDRATETDSKPPKTYKVVIEVVEG